MSTLGSATDLTPGTVVVGRYRIEEKLGQGGMGAVYRATQMPLGRAVALKVIKRSLTDDAIAVKRFEKEARAMATLAAPSIVVIHDFGTLDGSAPGETSGAGLFIAMELLQGEDLDERLARSGRLPWTFVAHVGAAVCDALVVAHGAGVVHRDLKPANVMLTGDDARPNVKVLDFGVAKLKDDGGKGLTETGLVVGTPGYIAPEQMSGVTDDPRSDLYALGVLLFEALTGRPPFDAETPMKLLLKHLAEPAPKTHSLMEGALAPTELLTLVDALLSKAPEERPASAAVTAQRLREIANDPRHAALSSTTERLTPLPETFATEGVGMETPISGPSPRAPDVDAQPSSSAARVTPPELTRSSLASQIAEPHVAPTTSARPSSTDARAMETPATGAAHVPQGHGAHAPHPLVRSSSKTLWRALFAVVVAGLLSLVSCGFGALWKLRDVEFKAGPDGLDVAFKDGTAMRAGKDGLILTGKDGKEIARASRETDAGTEVALDLVIDDGAREKDRGERRGDRRRAARALAEAEALRAQDDVPPFPSTSGRVSSSSSSSLSSTSMPKIPSLSSMPALPGIEGIPLYGQPADGDPRVRGFAQTVATMSSAEGPSRIAFDSAVDMYVKTVDAKALRAALDRLARDVEAQRESGALTRADAEAILKNVRAARARIADARPN